MKLKNILLLLSVLSTSLILMVRDVFNVDINQYIIFAFMSGIFAVLSRKNTIMYLAYTCGIVMGVNAYILLVGIIAVLLKNHAYLQRNKLFIGLSLFVIIWEFLNCFMSYHSPQLSQLLLYGGYICVFFCYFLMNKQKDENKDNVLYYSIGLGVSILIISIGILQNPLDFVFSGEGETRAAMGFSEDSESTHFVANANHLAYFSIVLISLLLTFKQEVFDSKLLFGGLLIIAFVAGLLSRSRTWILICVLLLIVIFMNQRGKDKVKILFMGVVLSVVLVFLFSDLLYLVFEGFFDRFEQENLSTAGSRTEIFEEYNKFMFNHFEYLLGGTGAIYYNEIARCSFSCHNAIQQIFVSYGILGCIFFAYVFIKPLRNRNFLSNRFSYIPFFTAVLFIQSIQFLNPFYLMLPIAFSSLASKINLHE